MDSLSVRQLPLERAVVGAFRRAGWQVLRSPALREAGPDLVVRRRGYQYVAELKSAPEARRDRLIPLLAQAILEAKAAASKWSASPRALPLAIIGAPHVPGSMVEDLRSFAARVAPDVAIGIVDFEGSRVFIGRGLEPLNGRPARSRKLIPVPSLKPSLHLFSDLNQWMLKVLLARAIPERLLNSPRLELNNVSALARAANVSLMSAFRCVSLLRADGFLDEQSRMLRVVRVEELLKRWRAANLKPVRDFPMRWLIPGDPVRQLSDGVRAHVKRREASVHARRGRRVNSGSARPRVCLALFAAADALGVGFVRGVAPHLNLERPDRLALESLGLVPAESGQRVDVFVRIPAVRESVFRAAVNRGGLPVCDVLQVWLDVVDHPSRGAVQAREIWRRVLAPMAREGAI